MFTLDHIAIAANTLEEGAEYVRDQLGVALVAGGEHPLMGTHNRLIGLADGVYLEVIAINPQAAAPAHPRWFDLDNFSGPPRITNWILRCDDLDAGLKKAPEGSGQPLSLTRGDLRWQMAVPPGGRLPFDNIAPALISWQGDAHPAKRLPASGLRLTGFSVFHPDAPALFDAFSGILDDTSGPEVIFATGEPGFEARFETPSGPRVLR